MADCEHKFVHLETQKIHAERGSIGICPAKNWKRVDRFFCEKCLEEKEIVKTAPWYEEKPSWF